METILPTCSLDGYTNNVCVRCGYSIITNRVNALPHNYLGVDSVVNGVNASYNTVCEFCGKSGEPVDGTLIDKCCIEGYGVFDATLKYLNISLDGTVTPADVTFDNAVIYFPSYVKIGDTVVEIKTIEGFTSLSIKSVYIPDTVTRIVGGTNGAGCFQHCYNMKNIVVGKGVTEIESYAFSMVSQTITVDEFVFKGTITRMGSSCISRISASSANIPYEFNTVLTYIGSYVSVANNSGGNILREVYITRNCDLTERFAFNGSNGLKRAYIEGGETADTAKELTQELFSGDASGLEIVIKGYVKATGQAVLPTNGARIFLETLDQAKVFGASVRAQGYYDRAPKSSWYICENDEFRYAIDNYTSDVAAITFKVDGTNPHYHVGITVSTKATCTQGGIVTGSCFICGEALEATTSNATPHRYDGGVFVTSPVCGVLGQVKYTCLDCGNVKLADTGYDLNAHNLDILIDIEFKNGYTENGTYTRQCTVCNNVFVEETPSFPALFTCLGYSVPENGREEITIGYLVNVKAISEYEEATGRVLKYGVFAAAKEKLGDSDIFDSNGNVAENAIAAEISGYKFVMFELKIVGFTDEYKEELLAMGAYVAINDGKNTEYSYMQAGTPLDGNKYCFISYNDVLNGTK